jgi:hypothetical protein
MATPLLQLLKERSTLIMEELGQPHLDFSIFNNEDELLYAKIIILSRGISVVLEDNCHYKCRCKSNTMQNIVCTSSTRVSYLTYNTKIYKTLF